MLATLKPSQRVKMVRRVLNKVVRVVLVKRGERHDKRANGQHNYF